MNIIEFNGLGEPMNPRFGTGTLALLVQPCSTGIVRIKILPPDDWGPELIHAINEEDLKKSAQAAIAASFPQGLDASRDWVLECPRDIALRARFADNETFHGHRQ